MVFQMLLCGDCYENIYTKSVQKFIIQGVERWIVCTPLCVKVFVTLAT
jgi:hypothetical protein